MKRFTHHCDTCAYQKSAIINGRQIDWYICASPSAILGGSILGRYGDKEGEYWSMAIDVISKAHRNSAMMIEANRIIVEYQKDSKTEPDADIPAVS